MSTATTRATETMEKPRGAVAPKPFRRNILQTFDVPGTKYETVIVHAELDANETTGRHQHPGIESGYVIAGEGTLFADGQAAVALKPGQSYRLPFGVTHEIKSGTVAMRVVATWVVEKGKPTATAVS